MVCRICNNTENNKRYKVREMMFGYRDAFDYFQCAQCECLQIAEIPANLLKYYPSGYHELSEPPDQRAFNLFEKFAKRRRDHYALFDEGFIGKFVYRRYPNEHLRSLAELSDLGKNMRILDVGCGLGSFLYALQEMGFWNLLGIDPLIEKDVQYKNGLTVLKKKLHEIEGKWDIVTFHRSFEHLTNPHETLECVEKILSDTGFCIIRIPTVSSYAWQHYGVNWVQLDAPRHFFLHSVNSMKIVSAKANLKLNKIVYDSTEFQFWGSEQYLQDIPLLSENSHAVNPSRSPYSRFRIKAFAKQAKKLNCEHKGDQAVFYLTRA